MSNDSDYRVAEKAFGVVSGFFWHNQYRALCDYLEEIGIDVIDSIVEGVADPLGHDQYLWMKVIATLQQKDQQEESKDILKHTGLQKAVDHLHAIAASDPKQFLHTAQLVQAEVERVSQNPNAPATYYLAAETAKENGELSVYALAQELQGVYWKSKGRMEYAHLHFANAVQGYLKLGNDDKVQLMESIHGHSLSFRRRAMNDSSLDDLSSTPSWRSSSLESSDLTDASTKASRRGSNALDNISYLKVANAIAEEIDLSALMLQIIRVVLENVGAEQGFLLLKQNNHYQLHAQAEASSDGIHVMEVVETEAGSPPVLLPKDIINYCAQTKKPVLLDNAQEDSRFVGDDYLKKQKVKSLICFPIIHKDNARAIFVLVNNAVSSVFTQQHIQFMTTLAPQFAVSIENAILYQQLMQLNNDLENTIGHRTEELKAANEELQAFSSSVSHDLKAPLRAISGLSLALKEDCAGELPEEGMDYIQHVCDASERMGHIIDGLLMLSQSTQSTLQWAEVDLSVLVNEKVRWLRNLEPDRNVVTEVQSGCVTHGDVQLLHQVMDNLLSNAWKYSHKKNQAYIEFGQQKTERNSNTFFVRDNGAGFDAANSDELFKPFRRFHTVSEFEGTGIGLATVSRIIKRHGGDIWVNSQVGKGATFYFSLSQTEPNKDDVRKGNVNSNANNQETMNQCKPS
ncbi:hypothetical protein A9Q81_27115 [Gammaproteobacteria bacterium 42_54_T18]|nr:hypothetical protein A9Q81_27115 [Gammaproteobacteria bacterium 42_54_T18]